MLVLTRRENERIVLPTVNTKIQVVRIAGSTVRLGIEAPPEIPVLREELLAELAQRQQNREATGANQDVESTRKAERLMCESTSSGRTLVDYEKLLDCLLVALEVVDGHLEQGNVPGARETLRKALSHLTSVHPLAGRSPASASGRNPVDRKDRERVALVVQNLKRSQHVIAPVLEQAGYKVRVVANGCQALDYLTGHARPEIIVLDFDQAAESQKKPCNVMKALNEIRKNPGLKGIKIIALGNRSPAELQVTIGPNGIDHWVRDGVQAEDFFKQLGR